MSLVKWQLWSGPQMAVPRQKNAMTCWWHLRNFEDLDLLHFWIGYDRMKIHGIFGLRLMQIDPWFLYGFCNVLYQFWCQEVGIQWSVTFPRLIIGSWKCHSQEATPCHLEVFCSWLDGDMWNPPGVQSIEVCNQRTCELASYCMVIMLTGNLRLCAGELWFRAIDDSLNIGKERHFKESSELWSLSGSCWFCCRCHGEKKNNPRRGKKNNAARHTDVWHVMTVGRWSVRKDDDACIDVWYRDMKSACFGFIAVLRAHLPIMCAAQGKKKKRSRSFDPKSPERSMRFAVLFDLELE